MMDTANEIHKHKYTFIGIIIGVAVALVMVSIATVSLIMKPSDQDKCQELADQYSYIAASGSDNGCMLQQRNGRWVDISRLSRADMLNYKEKHS